MSTDAAIEASGLCKSYGKVVALDGVDLSAPAGSVLGLLGPNGAGKTTAVRILATLLRADGGSARAAELLERFGLSDAADRLVRTYSGGMRRRLDLAAALIAQPPVLFLDEPTTGLDPRSRIDLWETIEDRVSKGTTVLLTTQYLDEADRLADRIAVIDRGRLLAEGTSDELKDRFGGERLDLTLEDHSQAEAATAALSSIATEPPSVLPSGALCFPVGQRQGTIAAAVRRLDEAGIGIDDVAMHRPTLDDVFLGLTGRAASEAEENGEADGEAS